MPPATRRSDVVLVTVTLPLEQVAAIQAAGQYYLERKHGSLRDEVAAAIESLDQGQRHS